MLHFKPIHFMFRYKNGHECVFGGTYAYCLTKYKREEDDVSEVFQLSNGRYVKISD